MLNMYEQLIVTCLLLGQPSNYTAALNRLEKQVVPAAEYRMRFGESPSETQDVRGSPFRNPPRCLISSALENSLRCLSRSSACVTTCGASRFNGSQQRTTPSSFGKTYFGATSMAYARTDLTALSRCGARFL